ncbi:MAG: cadherin domain-containing protein [bacterium]|nr:cadherin domain-containing protein [bacterium]MDE0352916.1 cadherin domain-containing protein [bacterium]
MGAGSGLRGGRPGPGGVRVLLAVLLVFALVVGGAAPLAGTTGQSTGQSTGNRRPAFPGSEWHQRSVAENVDAGTAVGDPVVATDPDGDTLTYTMAGLDADKFTVDSATGQIRTKAALDYEVKFDYNVNVSATDPDGRWDLVVVEISVTDVNEPPVISGDTAVEYAENGTGAVATYTATDPEDDAVSWSLSGDDGALFGIGTDGVLDFAAAPDFEDPGDADADNAYEVTVTASAGGQSATLDVTVTVTDADEPPANEAPVEEPPVEEPPVEEPADDEVPVNEPPTISGETAVEYAENGTGAVATYTATDPEGATITWSLGGSDSDAFTIDAGGELTFKSPLSLDAPADADLDNVYQVTVQAGDGVHTVTLEVAVTVTEAEPPAGDDESDENADPEGEPPAGDDESAGTVTEDEPPAGDGLAWTDPPAGVDGSEGQVDPDAAVGGLTAEDGITGQAGLPPVITGTTEVSVPENTSRRTIIAFLTVTDPDSNGFGGGEGGPDAHLFSFIGVSRIVTDFVPDYENPIDADRNNIYKYSVRVSDGHNYSAWHHLNVKITDVDEPPVIGGPATVEYAENGTGAVATYTAVDPEGAAVTWSPLEGADASSFTLTNGVLRFKSSPDYETKSSYAVTLVATDESDLERKRPVTVTVTNVDEPGVVTLAPLPPQIGTALAATLTDPDGPTEDVDWSWTYLYGNRQQVLSASVAAGLPSSFTPDADDECRWIRVTASYSDGEGDDKTAEAQTSAAVPQVQTAEPRAHTCPASFEEPPNPTRTVAENTAAGTPIGDPFTAHDPDGDTLTYQIGGVDSASFAIDSDTGQVSTKASPQFDGPNRKRNYRIWVTATDPSGATSPQLEVTIKVTDVNEPPVITGLETPSYAEGATEAVATYTANDPENNPITWSLGGADGGDFTISQGVLRFASLPSYTTPADADQDNVYQVNVMASDGPNKVGFPVTVTVTDLNYAPRISGPTSVRYGENGTGAVATYLDNDPDADQITWTLAGRDRDSFTITDGVLTFNSPPDYEAKPSYAVTVVATDPSGETSRRGVTVTVLNADDPGVVTLSSLEPAVGTQLRATLWDQDGVNHFITWTWTYAYGSRKFLGRSTHSLSNPARYTPTADDRCDWIRVTASYTDARSKHNATASAVTTSAVPAGWNCPARFVDRPNPTRRVAETAPAGTAIGKPFTALDPEGETLTYQIGGDDAESFAFDTATGQVSTKASLDFDGPSAKKTYSIWVKATDVSGATSPQLNVTIEVTSVNEPPAIDGPRTPSFVEKETTAVATYTATDPEDDEVTWSLGGTDRGDFAINQGVLRFKSPPDYTHPADADRDNVYEVTVVAADDVNEEQVEYAVTVTVTDANFAPVVRGPATVGFEENADGVVATYTAADPDLDEVTWTLEGADAQSFTITDGDLAFGSPPDFETESSYEVTVVATDPSGSTGSKEVTVTVINVDEPGVVTLSSGQPERGTALTATLTSDPDGAFSEVTWQWSWAYGVERERSGATASSYTPTASDECHWLRATASYTDPQGAGKTASAITSGAVQRDRNCKPTFIEDGFSVTRTLPEATPAGTPIGEPIEALDPEGGVLTYSLTHTDAHRFTVNAQTGQVSTKTVFDLDRSSRATAHLQIIAADPDGGSDFLEVTIEITAVDEPFVLGGPQARNYAENRTAAVATYTAADPEGVTIAWSLGGDDAALFTIGGGVLRFRSPPDYENPDDADTDNVYQVTVRASDGTNPVEREVTVTVTNVNEALSLSGPDEVDKPEGSDTSVATYTANDPEGLAITWSLTGTDAADFTLTDGVLAFKSAPNYDSPKDADTDNVYSITVGVEAGSESATLDITVTVTNVNFPPKITGGGFELQYTENGVDAIGGTYSTYSITDPEGDSFTVKLTGPDAADFAIEDNSFGSFSAYTFSFVSVPDCETPHDANTDNVYEFTLEMNDGNSTGTQDFTVTVVDESEPPRLAGPTATSFAENGTGDVATYTASDDEDDPVTMSLSGADAALFSLSAAGKLTFNASPNYDNPGDADTDNAYQVTVEASDDNGNTRKLEVTVTVTDVDETPTVSGLTTPSYAENGTGAVATYTSSALDPKSGGITWSVEGTDSEDFSITSGGGVLSFAEPPDFESPGSAQRTNTYKVTVVASDGVGNRGTLEVTVTVTDVNEPPLIRGRATITVEEGTDRWVDGYNVEDPESVDGALTLGGTDAEDFTLSGSGTLKNLDFDHDPDFESPRDADGDSVYEVTLSTTDGTNPVTLAVTITVTNLDEAGAVTLSSTDPKVGVALSATLTDPDGGVSNVTWTWVANGILVQEGASSSYTPTADDVGGVIFAEAGYTDAQGADKYANAEPTNAVQRGTANSAPAFPSTSVALSVDENTAAGTDIGAAVAATDAEKDSITYALGGTDAASFNIASGTGQLQTKAALDYETTSSYSVTVTATDALASAASVPVTITVTNVDEAGTVTLSTNQPQAPRQMSATLTDPDGAISGVTWQWSRAGGGDITGATSSSYTPVAGDIGSKLRATATYTDGHGADKTASATTSDWVIARQNNAPTFGATSASREVAENTAADTAIGAAVTATDADDDPLTYTLEGTDAASFDIDSGTGQLQTKAALDYETTSSYSVTVKAADALGASATITVTITVTNVNEAPSITAGPTAVADYAESGTGAVGTYTATDPEGVTIVWSLSGTDEGDFAISTAGVLSFGSSPDFEAAADADTNNVYSVTVNASDGNTTVTREVTVTVTNVDEPPSVTGGPTTVNYAENGTGAVGTYVASDPEGATVAWSLSGTDSADFSITGSGGVLTFASSPDFEGAVLTRTMCIW